MNPESTSCTPDAFTPHCDLGRFEGFNYQVQFPIPPTLTAAEVVNWDHDRQGEADFWPAGDRPDVELLFHDQCVSASALLSLDRLLVQLGGDSVHNLLRVHHAVNVRGADLLTLSRQDVEDTQLDIFFGPNTSDLRAAVARDIFPRCYPKPYRAWRESKDTACPFHYGHLLDAAAFWVTEACLGDQVAILVACR